MRLHAAVVGATGDICRPHYQVGRWTPHCTLATEITDAELDRARDLLELDWRFLTGVFEAADFVEFVPVVGVKRWPLAPILRSTRTP